MKKIRAKKLSLVKIMPNDKYDFKKYGGLVDFGNKLYNNKLSLDKPKNVQDEFLDLTYDLEKKVDKDRRGCSFTDENKEKINETNEDLKNIYKTRNDITDVFKNAENKQTNLDRLVYPDYFDKLVKFLDDYSGLSSSFGKEKKENY